jgi:hypothetical protein
MTQTSHLKSASITTRDGATANPPANTQLTDGAGAPGYLKSISDYSSTVSGDLAGSTYLMTRVPSNAIIKKVLFSAQAMTGGKLDLSVYYSDSTQDGTAPANQGLIVPTNGTQFFSGDIDCSAAVVQGDYTFANAASSGKYTQASINLPLWDALGLTSDPGGFFDVVAVCTTTGVTTGAPFSLQVDYV